MKSPSSNKPGNRSARGERGGVAIPADPPVRRARRNSHASKDWLWFDPDSAIERATEAILPLLVAEYIVHEASAWLDAELPEDWPAALAAKAERCFAKHPQFHRLVCSKADGGDAGIANLRKFMRHWTCSWLKRTRLSLYRRLPWDYALGTPLR